MTKRRKMYADKCRDRRRRKIQAAMRAWYVPKKVSLFNRLLDRLFK